MSDPQPVKLSTPSDLLADRLDEAAALVRRYILPLYRSDQHERPEFEGTGTLLQVGPRFFVTSAAHVFDKLSGGTFLILDNDVNLRLTHHPEQTDTPRSGEREHDRIDLGFIPLTKSEVDAIGPENFLSWRNLSSRDAAAPRAASYMIVGYAEGGQVRRGREYVYHSEQTRYSSPEAELRGYELTGLQRDFHLLLQFDPSTIRGPKGIGAPPSFRGMSGCGVWRINPLERYHEANVPRLVAVTIERPPKYAISLMSTRVEVLLATLRSFYPDLAEYIPPSPLVSIKVRGGPRNLILPPES